MLGGSSPLDTVIPSGAHDWSGERFPADPLLASAVYGCAPWLSSVFISYIFFHCLEKVMKRLHRGQEGTVKHMDFNSYLYVYAAYVALAHVTGKLSPDTWIFTVLQHWGTCTPM